MRVSRHRATTRRSATATYVLLALATQLLGVAPALTDASATADPSEVGAWIAPFSEGGRFDERPPQTKEESAELPTAVSITVTPDGRVLYWNGVEGQEDQGPFWTDLEDEKSRTRLLDLREFLRGRATAPTWTTPEQERGIGADLFCSDLRTLADGRLLAVGGTKRENLDADYNAPGGLGRPELWGSDEARVFDATTETWTALAPMHHARWYPTMVTLPDGRMLVAGGVERLIWYWMEQPRYVNETEVFDPATGTWTENGPAGEAPLPFYARLHLLPNGKVFYDATGQMWGPMGSTEDMHEWSTQRVYDPATGAWTAMGQAPHGGRSGSFSAMLPLEAPYDRARILIGGGTMGLMAPPSPLAQDLTEIVEVSDLGVQRVDGPPMNHERWYSSGVVLPSGEVIAISGGDRDDSMNPGTTHAITQPEMFDGERWVPLAPAARERIYHNTAILLGDGSILVGGHAPLPTFMWGPGNDDYFGDAFTSNFKDPSFEVFQPPYLFRGPRPRITHVRTGLPLGEVARITTPDAGRVTQVVLSRLPAVTHLADADQRTIEVPFTRNGNGTIDAAIPDDPAVALPGSYYLFLMTDNGEGPTPSKAAMVRVGAWDPRPAALPFGS